MKIKEDSASAKKAWESRERGKADRMISLKQKKGEDTFRLFGDNANQFQDNEIVTRGGIDYRVNVDSVEGRTRATFSKINEIIDYNDTQTLAEVRESLMKETARREVENILRRYQALVGEGIPDMEATRVVIGEFSEPGPILNEWPPQVIGLDLLPKIHPELIFDSGYPPRPSGMGWKGPNIYQDQTNWLGTSNKPESQPSMHGREGFMSDLTTPWDFGVNTQADALQGDHNVIYKDLLKEGLKLNIPTYHSDTDTSLPDTIEKEYNRPKPGEQPYMIVQAKPAKDPKDMIKTTDRFKLDIPAIHTDIDTTLPDVIEKDYNFNKPEDEPYMSISVKPKVASTKKLTFELDMDNSSLKIRETISELKKEFTWLTPDHIKAVKKQEANGKWLLIRASEVAITDHRGEGEPFRRLLSGDELHGLSRTGVLKGSDINHDPQHETGGKVMDGDYNKELQQVQFLHLEPDPEIIEAIKNDTISGVSINGGPPRSESFEMLNGQPCDNSGECFIVPHGVILGETDNIAFTYVVTNPLGMYWRGEWIPPANPGVKSTKIEIL